MIARRLWVLAAAAALIMGLGGLGLKYLQRSTHAPERATLAATEAEVSGTGANSEGSAAMAASGVATLPSSVMQHYYACHTDPYACRFDPLVADSPEEAQWLVTRGYPTKDQIEEAAARSMDELKRAAEQSGSAVDASLYAQGLLREGHHREAERALHESFSSAGNLYALHLLSDVYRTSDQLRNRPLAMAYLRLAYLAGDAKAGPLFVSRFDGAWGPELAYAEQRAAELRAALHPDANWPRP